MLYVVFDCQIVLLYPVCVKESDVLQTGYLESVY